MKKQLWRLYNRIPPIMKYPQRCYKYKKLIDENFETAKDDKLSYLYEKYEAESWKKAFYKLICMDKNMYEMLCAFTNNDIKCLNKGLEKVDSPILISVVKNEMKRIPAFINHYRKLGIKHFVILDNNSNDGTLEWLLDQKDCDVYFTKEEYSTIKREAWINRLLSYYGFNQWYLIVDSDEHFVYPGMESTNINDLILFLEKNGHNRVRSIMLDMYSREDISLINENIDNDYVRTNSYFDVDTYKVSNENFGIMVTGGPRERIFGLDVYLTKHPLFYFEVGDIQGHSHYQYPYKKNKSLPCFSALLHYKFLGSDLEKYRKRAQSGSFYNGSIEYKKYVELFSTEREFSFHFDGSAEYVNSNSLNKINLINDINFD
jgi:hypothetical protein